MRLLNNEPVWEDGDVIRVTFRRKDGSTNGKEYEYTRTDCWWPGENDWSSHDDATMTEAWHAGDLSVLTAVAVNNAKDPDGGTASPGGLWVVLSRDHIDHGMQDFYLFRDELQARRKADEAPDSDRYYTIQFAPWGDS
jgi:hypothetical protein